MRLLLVTQDFPPDVGGTQTYAFELARRFTDWCDDFAVMAPRVPGCSTTDTSFPFEVRRVEASYDLLSVAALPSLLLSEYRHRFDTTFHIQWPTAISGLAARKLGLIDRVFIAAHGRELMLAPLARYPLLDKGYQGTRRSVLQDADGLFPVSRYTAGLLRALGVDPTRIQVLHNGTDPARFQPLDASALRERLGATNRPTVLTVSRLVARKGIDTVIQALPLALQHLPDLLYLIGGDGPDRTRLEGLVRRANLSDHVRFLGILPKDELVTYYNAADIFVMPSREDFPHVEGFGIVFLEANACGKPVIGARTGGIPDAVLHEETGLLVEPDDPPGLAAALVRLFTEPDLAPELGARGRARVVNEANWNHLARRLYEALK